VVALESISVSEVGPRTTMVDLLMDLPPLFRNRVSIYNIWSIFGLGETQNPRTLSDMVVWMTPGLVGDG